METATKISSTYDNSTLSDTILYLLHGQNGVLIDIGNLFYKRISTKRKADNTAMAVEHLPGKIGTESSWKPGKGLEGMPDLHFMQNIKGYCVQLSTILTEKRQCSAAYTCI